MSSIPPILARATTLMASDQLSSRLQQTQRELFDVQRQISTGKRVGAPSDAPGQTSAVQFLRQQLSMRGQHESNLRHAGMMLNNVEAALKETNDVLIDAKSVALGQVGMGSDSETRRTTALTIDAKVEALMELGNRQFNDLALFGGRGGPGQGEAVFESFLGGVRYRGGEEPLRTHADLIEEPPFNAAGSQVFGALSARIESPVDLEPRASEDTRIRHVAGARGEGVGLGTIRVNVDGASRSVDLSNAESLGDVRTRVNAAIDELDPAAGGLAIDGAGFTLTANAGHTVAISDLGSGTAAADLGIAMDASGGSVAGEDVQRRLHPSTRLDDLGATLDLGSGVQITQGPETKVADFSEAETIEDMQNVVDQLGLGLRLQINERGDGLDLVSEVSGTELAVGENGGSTAADLGLRSFDRHTALSDFRDGLGVETVEGEPDVSFTLHDGTGFEVDLHGASTVGEVIGAIEAAADDAGLSVGAGGDFHVGFAETGTGLVITDDTAGGEDFTIANVGQSHAASHLGIAGNAGGDPTIASEDRAKVKVDGAFTHLIELGDALRNDDDRGITLAGEGLDGSLERIARAQAQNGVDTQRVEQARSRSEDQQMAEESMLSEIQDASLPEVITRFTQLQTQLQASLQVGAQNMQISLLDFLR